MSHSDFLADLLKHLDEYRRLTDSFAVAYRDKNSGINPLELGSTPEKWNHFQAITAMHETIIPLIGTRLDKLSQSMLGTPAGQFADEARAAVDHRVWHKVDNGALQKVRNRIEMMHAAQSADPTRNSKPEKQIANPKRPRVPSDFREVLKRYKRFHSEMTTARKRPRFGVFKKWLSEKGKTVDESCLKRFDKWLPGYKRQLNRKGHPL